MNNNRLSIQILFAPFKMFRSLRFKITLLLIAGTLCLINAQEPEFASPAHNPFGLMTEPGKASAIRKADFDHDDTAEIIVLLAESGVVEIKYYENEGDDEAPSFVFQESNPFGLLPGNILPRQFVDIDGDTLHEVFFNGFIQNTPVRMKENVGSKQIPNYDTAFTPNPYGITLPVSDGDTLDAVVPVFADIDSDGDYDLFYGGTFLNNMPDEAFYFSRNIDSSGNGTDPQFDTIEKNPFGLIFPEGSTFHWEIFQDMDCDGDLDMYMTGLNDDYYYFENIGTPTTPEFKEGVCIRRVCEYQDPFEPIDGRFWDIGGDGDPDMIAGTFASGFTYFENISPVPDLDFHISSDEFTYQFSDISGDSSIVQWHWDFGDGTSSEEQNPEHTYTESGMYTVWLTVSNHCRSNEDSITITVGIIDGINENNLQADIQLFPNPAKEQLTLVVETPEPLDKVEIRILDVSGKLLWQTDRKQSAVIMEEIIPLEAFLAGVYFLEIYSANKFASCRWVKID